LSLTSKVHEATAGRVHPLQQAFTLPSSMVQHQQLHGNAKGSKIATCR
jgi:hypothetical protein